MSQTFFVFLLAGLAGSAPGLAQTGGCQVPNGMTKDQKLACVRASSIIMEQPVLSSDQLTNGPDFDASQPDQSRFAYFTAQDTVQCFFKPHYAFEKVPGDSMKFQCWHMTPHGAFYTSKGESIAADDVKVVIETQNDGDKKVSLYPRNDSDNEHEIKAESFKVKYLKPQFPNHDPRFNEVFTSVASSRFMWVLGFPADHAYPVQAASCIGCTEDPFGRKLTSNPASLKDAPTLFPVTSAEREMPWDEIKSDGDETWSWNDAVRFYSDGEWTHQQRVEFDAYRLALGMIHYFNALPQQNRLDCAEWAPAGSGSASRVCLKPVIYVHDLGSTFGKKRSALDIGGTNPRGIFSAWEPQTVFENAQNCELRANLLGDKQVLKEAQDLMIQRLARLDAGTVKSIFRVARFNMVDQEQVRRLRATNPQNVDEAALDEWTNAFMKRIDEIRTAQNCKAN